MEDWAKRLDGFLEFNGNEILTDAGKISAEHAKLHAETEFEKYRIVQDRMFISEIMISFCWNLKNKQKTNLIEHKSRFIFQI